MCNGYDPRVCNDDAGKSILRGLEQNLPMGSGATKG